MKNSQEYSKKISKFYRDSKKKYGKIPVIEYSDPVDALIYAAFSEKMGLRESEDILKIFKKHFVDWNEFRVSRSEEICEIAGLSIMEGKVLAGSICRTLYSVFDKYNKVSLADLLELGKRQAKQDLEGLSGVTDFMVSYVFLTSLKGHAIPLTMGMVDYLKANELVDPQSDHKDIAGFLERQISASNAYEFYSYLRSEGEEPVKKTAKKVVAKTSSQSAKAKSSKSSVKTAEAKKTSKKKSVVKKKTAEKKVSKSK